MIPPRSLDVLSLAGLLLASAVLFFWMGRRHERRLRRNSQ